MKRLLKLLARLYPSAWRNRYGAEYDALLEDTTPRTQDAFNVLWGATKMHLTSHGKIRRMVEQPASLEGLSQISKKRPNKRTAFAIVITLTVGLTLAGAFSLYLAITPGGSFGVRIALFSLAAICFAFPARIAWVTFRRKWQTGHWLITEEELLAVRAKWVQPSASGRRWHFWSEIFSAVAFTFLAVVTWWDRFKHHSASRHTYDLAMAILWTAIAAQTIWSLTHRRRGSPPPNRPSVDPPAAPHS